MPFKGFALPLESKSLFTFYTIFIRRYFLRSQDLFYLHDNSTLQLLGFCSSSSSSSPLNPIASKTIQPPTAFFLYSLHFIPNHCQIYFSLLLPFLLQTVPITFFHLPFFTPHFIPHHHRYPSSFPFPLPQTPSTQHFTQP